MQIVCSRISGLVTLLVLLLATPVAGFQSLPKPSPGLTNVNEDLIKAQKANEAAQAEYYKELTRSLRKPTPNPSSTPEKSFSTSIAENPASVVGIIGTILAALFAATVGLFTLFVNSLNAAKAQRDTQFYEALKRFGDKDSASMRSSAAGLLTQMAKTEWTDTTFTARWPFMTVERSKRYLVTSTDQLIAGFLLEENEVALTSIASAIEQLIPSDSAKMTAKLFAANRAIQSDLASQLAKLFVINEISSLPPAHSTDQKEMNLWKHAEALISRYDRYVVRDLLLTREEAFSKLIDTHSKAYEATPPNDRRAELVSLHHQMRITSERLWMNVFLLCKAMRWPDGNPVLSDLRLAFLVEGDLKGINLKNKKLSLSQLAGANLRGAKLEKTDLSRSFLKNANLQTASLAGASLLGAHLEGANLSHAKLEGTILGEASIDEFTDFEKTNWWKAEIRLTSNKEEPGPDANLLDKLFERYGHAVPENSYHIDSSVREYMERRQKGDQRDSPPAVSQ